MPQAVRSERCRSDSDLLFSIRLGNGIVLQMMRMQKENEIASAPVFVVC